MAVFPDIPPDFDTKRTKNFRVLSAPFGDGYSQVVGDGINTQTEMWKVSFSDRPRAEIQQIVSFLDSVGAETAFSWTPPYEASPRLFRLVGDYVEEYIGFDAGSVKFDISEVYA